jgi:nucleoside-triphosphatase THEP1
MDWVATGAFHDSDELYDEPKCHPNTRVAVLNDIMKWVQSEAEDDFIMWLFGSAGAGKSAIAKKIAELAAEKGLLIGTFFFSRRSSTRNIKDRLIATLAYQMTVSMPDTRTLIEEAIERDPAIFHKHLQVQIESLLIKPFQTVSRQTIPCPKLIIIDGLDECNDSQAQVSILDALSRSFSKHKSPIICLVASRPETDILASFNGKEPLRSNHCRLVLDDTYLPDDDICRFFRDKFEDIRCTHRFKSTIPNSWPTEEVLEALVEKSSGQFIFAATVVRFVESNRHRPVARLDGILGISPPGNVNPFTELDEFYKQILSSVDDIQLTLYVLSLYTSVPSLVGYFGLQPSMSAWKPAATS